VGDTHITGRHFGGDTHITSDMCAGDTHITVTGQVSFTGHRSQVTGHRSQVTIKTLSKFRDVTITEIPEKFIDVSMQQTLTKNVLIYNFN